MFDRAIWNEFNNKVEELLHMLNGRRIAIWGYGYSGWCTEHLLKHNHRIVDVIMDQSGNMNKIHVNNPLYILEMDPESWFIIITFNSTDEEQYIESRGVYKGNKLYQY